MYIVFQPQVGAERNRSPVRYPGGGAFPLRAAGCGLWHAAQRGGGAESDRPTDRTSRFRTRSSASRPPPTRGLRLAGQQRPALRQESEPTQ